MLSNFGKFTRKLRIDKLELLKDMAEKLEVTTSYLSAVEMGKRNIPASWGNVIANKYSLSEEDIEALNEAIDNSQESLKLKLKDYNENDKSLMLAFARKFDELENDDKDSIMKILYRERR